jgi:multiple sugar transport system substrate-binding protein
MMAKKKLWLTAMATVAIASTLAACSGTPSDTGGKVSLRVLTWTANPDQLKIFNSIADDFMAANPDVSSVEFESVPAADLPTVLTTQLSAGSPPDVSWLGIEDSKQFIDAGVLLDLEPTLKDVSGYDFDDLIPSLQSHWQTSDGLFGVPMSTSGRAMYYNADLFKAAGVPNPDEMIAAGTWDWEHFAMALKAISDTQGVPGFVVGDTKWSALVPLMYAYGAMPWNEDATKCTMDSPEMTAAMTLYHNMLFTDKSTPLPSQEANFWGGQAGATSTYISSAKLLNDAKFAWGIVPTPGGPGGDKQQVGQTSWVAFKAGKNTDAAARLVAFLTNSDSQTKLAQFFAPTRASLLNTTTLHNAIPILSEAQLQPLVDATKANGDVAPVSKNGATTNAALDSALNEFLYEPNADVPTALKQICGKLDTALASE